MKKEQISKIREFNRFYAKLIGLLDKTNLNTNYSLAETRVLREIKLQRNITANDILEILELDKGYLSRILKVFEKKQMIIRTKSEADGRAFHLNLTKEGEAEFYKIDKKVDDQLEEAFAKISDSDYEKLIENMQNIKRILDKRN